MTGHLLGAGGRAVVVNDNVGAEFDRALVDRRREGRIDDRQRPALPSPRGDGRYVGHDHQRVADRLDPHHRRPFGGGEGMVLKPEPIFAAVETLLGTSDKNSYPDWTQVVLLSPQGKPFKHADAELFAGESEHLVLICGRYEGVVVEDIGRERRIRFFENGQANFHSS